MLTDDPAFKNRYSLRDQIERAAVSVSNNIAEGFERGTTQELLTFLYIARGSAGEVRSMFCLLERIPAFADLKHGVLNPRSEVPGVSNPKSEVAGVSNLKSEVSNLKSEISNLKSLAESISRQLRAWADSLQNSGIKGQRYLTDKTRKADQGKRERDEFLRTLDQIRQGVSENIPKSKIQNSLRAWQDK